MPPIFPSCTTLPAHVQAGTRLEHAVGGAEAYVTRCRRVLDRLNAAGKRTRRVRMLLWLASGRLAVLRHGLRCFG